MATRKYQSQVRKNQADQTRRRILGAAKALFKTKGYEATAIDAIAQKAGVSGPTIYSVFGSKREILKVLIESAMFGQATQEAVKRVMSISDPRERLRSVSSVARTIHDAQFAAHDLYRGAGVVSPEIAAIERERENMRYQAQLPVVDFLFKSGIVRKGISKPKVRDVVWSLTGTDVYRMLVVEKGWTSDEYEQWLGDTLVQLLI